MHPKLQKWEKRWIHIVRVTTQSIVFYCVRMKMRKFTATKMCGCHPMGDIHWKWNCAAGWKSGMSKTRFFSTATNVLSNCFYRIARTAHSSQTETTDKTEMCGKLRGKRASNSYNKEHCVVLKSCSKNGSLDKSCSVRICYDEKCHVVRLLLVVHLSKLK